MSRLDGKVAVVTGAAYGNGRGIAVGFAEQGTDGTASPAADLGQLPSGAD